MATVIKRCFNIQDSSIVTLASNVALDIELIICGHRGKIKYDDIRKLSELLSEYVRNKLSDPSNCTVADSTYAAIASSLEISADDCEKIKEKLSSVASDLLSIRTNTRIEEDDLTKLKKFCASLSSLSIFYINSRANLRSFYYQR